MHADKSGIRKARHVFGFGSLFATGAAGGQKDIQQMQQIKLWRGLRTCTLACRLGTKTVGIKAARALRKNSRISKKLIPHLSKEMQNLLHFAQKNGIIKTVTGNSQKGSA
jgi:hypothetical protein